MLIAGKDLLAQAATGTGKTAAFALPMLQIASFRTLRTNGILGGLVLVPTRELSMQVAEAIHKYAKGVGVSVVPVYGGAPISTQIKNPRARRRHRRRPRLARALDHIRRKTLKLSRLRMLSVLDEADGDARHGASRRTSTPFSSPRRRPRQTALFLGHDARRAFWSIAQRHLNNPVARHDREEKTTAGKLPRACGRRHTLCRDP